MNNYKIQYEFGMSLPNLSYMSMADTGASGAANPVAAEDLANDPGVLLKRLKHEYGTIVQNHELVPSNVTLSWTKWDNKSDTTKMPTEWTFVVEGEFELVVHFPYKYPFEKPYYYVKTNGGTLVEVKQYLLLVTMEQGPNGKGPKPGLESQYDYVRDDKMTAWLAQSRFSPALTVAKYISELIGNKKLFELLQMAPATSMA